MNQILPKVMVVIAVLAVGALVVGLLLPSEFQVKREIVIDVSPETIHAYVNDLDQWPRWGPWLEDDPTIVTTVGAITEGLGANQAWTGDSGSGQLMFTASDPARGVEYDLSFDDGAFRCEAALLYTPVQGGTRVTWLMRGDMEGNLLGRYFVLGMDRMAGPMFERGLEKLKTLAESG